MGTINHIEVNEEISYPDAMVTVRIATPQDEDVILLLLLDMATENSKYPVSVQKTLNHIRHVIHTGCVAIAESGGEIIGSAGVHPQSPWHTNSTFLGDSWFYVKPTNRASRAAVMLKKTMFDFAQSVGMDLVLAVFSISDADRKTKFFAKDMKSVGGTFMKEF